MKRKLLFAAIMIASALGANLYAQISADKVYTIANNNDANMFMQDNGNQRVALGSKNDKSYWKFVPTGNADCYYIQNAVTGKYIQGYTATEQEVATGDTGVEYYVKADASGSLTGKFRFAVTSLEKHDFSDGTLGLNWKNNNTVQSFASVAGGNPRSAWTVTEAAMPEEPEVFTFDTNKKYSIVNFQDNAYFMKDGRTGCVLVETGLTSNALWQFEASGTDNCYYVRNALTGKYMQSTKTNEDPVLTADTRLEIMVVNDLAKGLDVFGFASTDQDDLSFKDDKTFGANWNAGGYAQGYAVTLGGRDRSFWKVAEVPTVDFADDVDNTTAITDAAGNGKNAVVTRSMAKDMWNTLVVPHAMNAQAITRNFGDGAKVAELTDQSNGNLTFSTVDAIEAGKPYLVKPTIDVVAIITMNTTVASGLTTSGEGDYQFVGIYEPTVIDTDDYFMAAYNTLMKNGAGGQMKAFRAYFQATSSQVKALVGFSVDETETGIIAPDGTVYEDTRIFNLAGQQVNMNNTRKGIYIINGKKFIK